MCVCIFDEIVLMYDAHRCVCIDMIDEIVLIYIGYYRITTEFDIGFTCYRIVFMHISMYFPITAPLSQL